MMSPFKITNLMMSRRRKLQFVIMLSYGPIKLLDASKAFAKITNMKISYKQSTRF